MLRLTSALQLLAAVAVLTGCVVEPLTEWRGSARFSPRERSAIVDAFAEWDRASDGGVSVRITFDFVMPHSFDLRTWRSPNLGVGRIYRTDIDSPGWLELAGRTDARWDGLANESGGKIALVPSIAGDRLPTVAMHEIGHVYGLGHEPATLMGRLSTRACIDDVTIARFCSMNYCGPLAGSTCNRGN